MKLDKENYIKHFKIKKKQDKLLNQLKDNKHQIKLNIHFQEDRN